MKKTKPKNHEVIIRTALKHYMEDGCAAKLSTLVTALCLNIPGEDYTDGDIIDITIEVCDLVRIGKAHKITELLEKWGVVEVKELN